jgi:hypothetical protein
VNITIHPADPECLGSQWHVGNEDKLVELVAQVLVGQSRGAAEIINGVMLAPVPNISAALKDKLRSKLLVSDAPLIYHRDGLLFEVICWIAAQKTASAVDLVSDPHLSSTQQGIDALKISFDNVSRSVTHYTICEQKCTAHARDEFRDNVLPAFSEWLAGVRDNFLVQLATNMLVKFQLTDLEWQGVYSTLVVERPMKFQAALTVTPTVFDAALCVALFKGYSGVTPQLSDRVGDTFPLVAVREWFEHFAKRVWLHIDKYYV